MKKISNERKNLSRLAGEFLVASRLTQRGYMVSLQWGATIGYDLLVFDKNGNNAFIEVKSTASYPRRWALQKKYANPQYDVISLERRWVCCVDLTAKPHPDVYVFPAGIVADALKYFYRKKGFSKSDSYKFALNAKPANEKMSDAKSVGEYISAQKYLENYSILGLSPLH